MQIRRIIQLGTLSAALVGAGIGIAQNVNAGRHPNLAAAQRLSEQAYQKVVAAQNANEFDMAGHAAKAKDLLDQANRELAQAAGAANRR